jgi:hypothetical protein
MSSARSVRRALALGLSVFVLYGASACGSHGGATSDSSNLAETPPPGGVSDQELDKMMKSAPVPVSQAKADEITVAALAKTLTTTRLKMMHDFAVDGFNKHKQIPTLDTSGYGRVGTQVEVFYWGMPRDLTSSPAGFGGQSFEETIRLVQDDDDPSPFQVKVDGVASRAYELSFTIGEHKTTVHVPAGADARATAQLVAQAINTDNPKIIETLVSGDAFKSIGDNPGDFDEMDGIKATTSLGTVVLSLSIGG